jgi:hypothetical protein
MASAIAIGVAAGESLGISDLCASFFRRASLAFETPRFALSLNPAPTPVYDG